MKTTRSKKSNSAPARVRKPSLAVRQAFLAEYGPKPGPHRKPVDAVGTLLRLRRSDDPPGLSPLALAIGPQMKARLASEAKRHRKTPERFAAELLSHSLDDIEDARIVRRRLKKPGRIYTAVEIERELGL